jgi:hypothetical protein
MNHVKSPKQKADLLYKFLLRYGNTPVFDIELLCGKELGNMTKEEINLEERCYRDFLLYISDTIRGIEYDDKLMESIERILSSHMDDMLVSFFFRTNIPNFPQRKLVDPNGLFRDVCSPIYSS